jgi:hypothetical protein
MKLSIHHNPVPKLKLSGAIPLLSKFIFIALTGANRTTSTASDRPADVTMMMSVPNYSLQWHIIPPKVYIYRTIILPVVLYGCETWSLTLREERRLRVFENRVLRRIFGPRRDKVMGGMEKIT